MPTVYRTGLIWSDANGFTRLTTFNLQVLDPLPWITTLTGKSNADWANKWTGVLGTQTPAAANNVFNSVLDTALLQFETASGSIVKVALPAPVSGAFDVDGQTVDPANVAAIIAQALTDLCDSAGNPVVSYLGGFYARTGRALVGGS